MPLSQYPFVSLSGAPPTVLVWITLFTLFHCLAYAFISLWELNHKGYCYLKPRPEFFDSRKTKDHCHPKPRPLPLLAYVFVSLPLFFFAHPCGLLPAPWNTADSAPRADISSSSPAANYHSTFVNWRDNMDRCYKFGRTIPVFNHTYYGIEREHNLWFIFCSRTSRSLLWIST